MKHLVLCFSLIFVFSNCSKENDTTSADVEINIDFRECACCGGLIVKLKNESNQIGFQSYQDRFDPIFSDINEFPAMVKVVYESVHDGRCVASDGQIKIIKVLD